MKGGVSWVKNGQLPPPCARWPGTPGSWLAGHCLWVLVWTGACYWHGVGGFMFNSSSSWVKNGQVGKATLHVVAHNRGGGIPKTLNQRQGPVVRKASVRGRRSCGRACMRMRGALIARGSFGSKNRPCVDGSVASLAGWFLRGFRSNRPRPECGGFIANQPRGANAKIRARAQRETPVLSAK